MTVKQLSSGVKCYIIPQNGFVQKQAMAVVRFGSDTAGFTANGTHFDVPAGTAHFMEHKMFDNNGENAMETFAKLSADVNAYTAFDQTAYYFNCTDNFYESLFELAKMISTPNFTKQGIESERKIISAEIDMYKDDAPWQAYFGLLGTMFPAHPIKNEITGSKEDIEKITEDILYLCYNNYYTPSNIAFIAAGDIDEDKTAEIIESGLSLPKDTGSCKDIIKDYGTGEKLVHKNMDIKMPFFYIGSRLKDTALTARELVKNRIMLECTAGECSLFYQELIDKELVETPLGFDVIMGRDYGAKFVFGEAKEPERVLERFLKNRKGGLLNIEAAAKKQRSAIIMQTESINGICGVLADCFAKDIEFLDILQNYDTIDTGRFFDTDEDDVYMSIVGGRK